MTRICAVSRALDAYGRFLVSRALAMDFALGETCNMQDHSLSTDRRVCPELDFEALSSQMTRQGCGFPHAFE